MAEWGRKEYAKKWPSRTPVWTWTVEWAKERKGWVFLTSKPTMRERMRPLISLWLDLLVRRLMNDDTVRRKTWFVLDELASLQRLPQLSTAVTENGSRTIRWCWASMARRRWREVAGFV